MARTIVTLVALAGIAFSSSGCALAVAGMAGYMISQHNSQSQHHEDCEKALQQANAKRPANDQLPDTCG